MRLKPIQANMTELNLGGGKLVLLSYKTPVAYSDENNLWYKTEKRWSNTTSRHINKWLKSFGVDFAQEQPQEFFDNLIAGVK